AGQHNVVVDQLDRQAAVVGRAGVEVRAIERQDGDHRRHRGRPPVALDALDRDGPDAEGATPDDLHRADRVPVERLADRVRAGYGQGRGAALDAGDGE